MSRIGRKPVPVPANVKVSLADSTIQVEGPKGKLAFRYRDSIGVAYDEAGKQVLVTRGDDERENRALHGLTRSLIANMVTGVTQGFEKRLEIQGVGYRALPKGKDIELQVGFSHPVPISAPEGIEFEVPAPTQIVVKGNSKQAVGEIAARIRKVRPPEPYKGKGIRYADEYVARKVGKRA